MAKFIGYEACPRCVANGRDRRGDNLGRWDDGSGHCFSCGKHILPKTYVRRVKENVDESKAVLPRDFTREVPAAGWKWLLQYGLPYTYWKPFTGYSESEERLILTYGTPIRFSQGRYLGEDKGEQDSRGRWSRRAPRKWKFYGNGHGFVEILGEEKVGAVVLVEDIISCHKVAQVAPCLCLFGTNLHDVAMKKLLAFKRPVTLWLDGDQYTLLASKLNRLVTLLDGPVSFINTEKDPKGYSIEQIKEILK